MKRLVLPRELWIGFAIFLAFTACDFNNPWDYSVPAQIEFTIAGGFVGIHTETRIDETGHAQLTQYHLQKYVIQYQLTQSQLDNLKLAFDRANFLTLKNKYPQKYPIVDGEGPISISYTVDGATKTVVIEPGAEPPQRVGTLLEELYRVNEIILENPDAGTLLIDRTYTIKVWPFSDSIKLGDHSEGRIYFNNTDLYRQIFDFLNQFAQQSSLDDMVFWEGDSLFTLRLEREGPTFEDNIGSYVQVGGLPVRFWPAEFGFALSDIPETGRILEAPVYHLVRRLLMEYQAYPQLFIFDELKEEGKAVSLALLSGRPE